MRLAVLAVGGHQVVRVAERLGGADDGRLLADAEVEEAADLRLGVHLAGALLEAADEQHLLEDGEAGVLVREAVLDLAETDLLEAYYLVGARAAVSALVFAALRGTVTGLGGVAGSHWPGEYPSLAGFNSRFPRLGGPTRRVGGFVPEPIPHPVCDSGCRVRHHPGRERGAESGNEPVLLDFGLEPSRRGAAPHAAEVTPRSGRNRPLRGGRRPRTARRRRRWSARPSRRARTPRRSPRGACPSPTASRAP